MEELLKCVPEEVIDNIEKERHSMAMVVCLCLFVSNIVLQLIEFAPMYENGFVFGIAYQWGVTVVMAVLLFLYYKCRKSWVINPVLQLITLRNNFAMMDFEGRRFRKDTITIFRFTILQVMAVLTLMFIINVCVNNKFWRWFAIVLNFILLTVGPLIVFTKQPFSFSLVGELLKQNPD